MKRERDREKNRSNIGMRQPICSSDFYKIFCHRSMEAETIKSNSAETLIN